MSTKANKDTRKGGQYASAMAYFGGSNPNLTTTEDQFRFQAYQLYDDIYHNHPETFKANIRGEDDEQKPIYLPAAGTLVEAVSRFLGVEFDFVVSSQDVQASVTGAVENLDISASDVEIQQCQAAFQRLFKREQMYRKFESQKTYSLVRGDAMWHVVADDTKTAGRRISIYQLHPGQYMPIYDPIYGTDIVGCHLISVVNHPSDPKKQACQRQTYLYELDKDGNRTGVVTSETGLYELGKWDDRTAELKTKMVKLKQLAELKALPPLIDSIPVYHMKNSKDTNDSFGRSELAGFETLINGMNQSITDEDMTLVMQGLGMYWTDAPPPMDDEGNELSWAVGPGQVVEVGAGQQFGRLTGVSSVAPFQEHINALESQIQKRVGLSDVAVGEVDVSVVESGIALKMKLAPILAHNAPKEQEFMAVLDNMFWDLAVKWFPSYEGLSFGNAVPECVFGDALPIDRKAVIQEVMDLLGSTPPLITMDMAMERISEIGYTYGDNAVEELFGLMARISDTLAGTTQQNAEVALGSDEVVVEEEQPVIEE